MTSYAVGRAQTVIVDRSKSSIVKLGCGVPLGSVLGPLLFVHYTKDVSASIRRHGLWNQCYADDACWSDYCNFLFAGLPACDIAQLLSVQNAAARLFGGVPKHDSVTPVFRDDLHWLPIKEWINFKIGVLTYKAQNGLAPSYLSDVLVPLTVNPLRNRSDDRGDLTVPRARNTTYSYRSFAVIIIIIKIKRIN